MAAPFRASTTVSANWSGHTGFTNIVQGAASYVTGSHSAKFGVRYHKNDANVSGQLLQQLAAQVHLPGRRPLPADDVRRPGLAPGTAAEHVRVVCAGSLDVGPPDAAGRTPLRAPQRLLPSAADGAEHLPAHRRGVPGPGRSAPSEGPACRGSARPTTCSATGRRRRSFSWAGT